MLKIAANKAATAAPSRLYEHRLLIADADARGEVRAQCERCGTEIGQGPYTPDERERLFGADKTYVFGRLSTDPAPVDVANPMTEADIAAETAFTAAQAAHNLARTKLEAAERELQKQMSRRQWDKGPSADEQRAEAADSAAADEAKESLELAGKLLVRRNAMQRARGARIWNWMRKHTHEW